ncbi:MAG: PA14 domain-containing protein [Candidatus Omnitrophica bacterium]|nr:PA14 domain-containing protein [Candidatus Omnitrophota bacterium]MDD5737366.1 PA14 domain-containing protein [Candidatus Omnitrophota bacterium]
MKVKRGVALIIAVGVLALVAMIATSFAINMQMEYRATLNFVNQSQAANLAQAGIDRAIADIRSWAANNTYNAAMTNIASNYTSPGTEVDITGGSYQVFVEREDQKININAIDETDYPWIDTLMAAGLSDVDVARIIDYRDPDSKALTQLLRSTGVITAAGNETNAKNAPYATVEEVRLVLNNDTKYNAIKNLVTVSAPLIQGGLIGKYYCNRYGDWDNSTILSLDYYKGKVVELGAFKEAKVGASAPWPPSGTFGTYGADGDNVGWSEAHDAEFAGGYIATDWTHSFGLDRFGTVWTGFIYIPPDKVGQNITFKMRSENGVRLYIDGTKLIEDWTNRSMGEWPATNVLSCTTNMFAYSGWHPIKIEFYNEINQNMVELKWNALPGGENYVPADYFAYYPTSYYGDRFQDNAAAAVSYKTPGTMQSGYDSAGILKIVSTGRAKRADGAVIAEKRVTLIVEAFNTLTQTTRAEFSAAWFSDLGNYSDGEIKNVNWLDSCPTSPDSFNALTWEMRWDETGYTRVMDAIKLGFWDNFDDDVAFTVVNWRGGYWTRLKGVSDFRDYTFESGNTYSLPHSVDWLGDQRWDCSFYQFLFKEGANGSYCLRFDNEGYYMAGSPATQRYPEERTAELNGSFFTSDAGVGRDIFARSYIYDDGQKQEGSIDWHRPPSKRLTNPGQPTAVYTPSWIVGWLMLDDYTSTPSTLKPGGGFYTVIDDGDNDLYWVDKSEMLCPGYFDKVPATYSINTGDTSFHYVAGAVGLGNSYRAYYSYRTPSTAGLAVGAVGTDGGIPSISTTRVMKARASNLYYPPINEFWEDVDAGKTDPEDIRGYDLMEAVAARNGDWFGCDSENVTIFDNVRVIYPRGFFVSTPMIARLPTDNANINWGTISYDTTGSGANTSVTMYARAASSLPTNDNFATTYADGASISSLSGSKFQYKALMATSALNPGNGTAFYSSSSVTPVLTGVTATYYKQKARVLYQQ